MKRFTLLLLAAVACAGLVAPAHAVPQAFQYQGRLTDPAGAPIHAPATVTFSLYADAESEEALWTQTFENLPLDNGRFSVLLGGDEAPFTQALEDAIEEGSDLFLGIQVNDDDEMAPRQTIASVAYALRAGGVDGMPGVAFHAVQNRSVSVNTSLSVASVEVSLPQDGYVLVTASGTLTLDNTTGRGSRARANVGEALNAAPETAMGMVIAQVDSADVRTTHYIPFHSQRVYEKEAGNHLFHLNIRNLAGSVSVNRPSITAIFFPTAIGTTEIEAATTTRDER